FSAQCAKAARVPGGKGVPVTFGFLLYDGVEPIELAAYGVLSIARRITPEVAFFTIAPRNGVVTLANGLRIVPDYAIDHAPRCDVLIVEGGSWAEPYRLPLYWRNDPGGERPIGWPQGDNQTASEATGATAH